MLIFQYLSFIDRVPEALNFAHEHGRVHRDITQSTKGIVFMGTPHLGADVAAWGKLLGNIGNVVTFGSFRTDLLKDLKSKSREFGEIAKAFVERAADLQIVSLFERRPTKGILVPSGSTLVFYDAANTGLDCG